MDNSTTIAAVATPEGSGAIGVIKISGPDAIAVVCSVFRHGSAHSGKVAGSEASPDSFETWRLYFGHIFDRGTDEVIDEVILAVMRAPASYTREDVVEIQAHSGPIVLDRILGLLFDSGIVPAQPGEFTRRAFVNGRIDLTRAEAVSDLINASSDAALDMALTQMTGGLSDFMADIRSALVSALSVIEAVIDFPDEAETDFSPIKQIQFITSTILDPVFKLIDAYESGRFIREGIRVVIIGRPNVGKSSLMNRLISKQRAIVTDIAGTTRDCIEAQLIIRGISLAITDTAGLRRDPDPIERLGIEKTMECIDSADILLYVIDAGASLCDADLQFYEQLAEKNILVVINKTDLSEAEKKFNLPDSWQNIPLVEVSAIYGTGIEALKEHIADQAFSSRASPNSAFTPNWRQKCLLDKTAKAVSAAADNLSRGLTPELVSIDLREALGCVDEITGRYVQTDVLDQIFSKYCVGK